MLISQLEAIKSEPSLWIFLRRCRKLRGCCRTCLPITILSFPVHSDVFVPFVVVRLGLAKVLEAFRQVIGFICGVLLEATSSNCHVCLVGVGHSHIDISRFKSFLEFCDHKGVRRTSTSQVGSMELCNVISPISSHDGHNTYVQSLALITV